MKKYLIAIAMMLSLTASAGAAPQPVAADSARVELTDSTKQDELEAFSDTTAVDTASQQTTVGYTIDPDFDDKDFDRFLRFVDTSGGALSGLLIVLFIFTLLFVLSPIVILAVLFYFIYKNRKQRMQYAQQAMQNGQPSPDDVAEPQQPADRDLWAKGMRQIFLGAGLAIFLGLVAGKVGFGIGALVLCIGVGNLVIARNQKTRDNSEMNGNNIYRF